MSHCLTFPYGWIFFPVFIQFNFLKPGVLTYTLYAVKFTLLNAQIMF